MLLPWGLKTHHLRVARSPSWPSLDFKTRNNPCFSSSLMLFPSVNVIVGMQDDVGTQVPWVCMPCLHRGTEKQRAEQAAPQQRSCTDRSFST